jgi:ABC-type polysaccharide/polyol phosphate transport system ATPase subunit
MAPVTPGIVFDGVWKKFRRGEVHDSLRDLIPALARRVTGRARSAADLQRDEFWAVRDVSFTIEPGQTLGLIGNNGAGKSTILKILTRILRPSRGSYLVRGRIGALIEVAAGFHPDLTGRENIFLQGAIMGMGRTQTYRKLDEIIAFSEIEQFIDTPVKRYSSGMNARLGFSIAAHLDPDVLIIDEVLAVGDYQFQRKAFGRIRDLARSGMPVVVVSHQLDRIAELCTEAMLLSQGSMVCRGTPADVIGAYMRGASSGEESRSDLSPLTITSAELLDGNEVLSGESVRFRITGTILREITKHVEPVGIIVRSAQSGDIVYATGTSVFDFAFVAGPFSIDVTLQMNVQPGIYLADIGTWDRADEKQLLAGPSLNVRVSEGRTFLGMMNLNAAMQLRQPAPGPGRLDT